MKMSKAKFRTLLHQLTEAIDSAISNSEEVASIVEKLRTEENIDTMVYVEATLALKEMEPSEQLPLPIVEPRSLVENDGSIVPDIFNDSDRQFLRRNAIQTDDAQS